MLATVTWYREIPVNGNLVRASSLYNAFYMGGGGVKTEDLVDLLIKLIDLVAIPLLSELTERIQVLPDL